MSTDVDGTGVSPNMLRLLKSVAPRGAFGGLALPLSSPPARLLPSVRIGGRLWSGADVGNRAEKEALCVDVACVEESGIVEDFSNADDVW